MDNFLSLFNENKPLEGVPLGPEIFFCGGVVVTSGVDGLVNYMSLGDKIKTQELCFH